MRTRMPNMENGPVFVQRIATSYDTPTGRTLGTVSAWKVWNGIRVRAGATAWSRVDDGLTRSDWMRATERAWLDCALFDVDAVINVVGDFNIIVTGK